MPTPLCERFLSVTAMVKMTLNRNTSTALVDTNARLFFQVTPRCCRVLGAKRAWIVLMMLDLVTKLAWHLHDCGLGVQTLEARFLCLSQSLVRSFLAHLKHKLRCWTVSRGMDPIRFLLFLHRWVSHIPLNLGQPRDYQTLRLDVWSGSI